jgi:hypothetical protein
VDIITATDLVMETVEEIGDSEIPLDMVIIIVDIAKRKVDIHLTIILRDMDIMKIMIDLMINMAFIMTINRKNMVTAEDAATTLPVKFYVMN